MVIIRPGAPLISDAILIVEVILAILLTLGFICARKHRGTRHHWIMLSSFVVHIVFGVALMVISFSILLSISVKSGGGVILLIRTLAPDSSTTSIALSGKHLPVIYLVDSSTA